MDASKTLLHMKYAKIVMALANELHCSYEYALDLFYCSSTHDLIENGVSDLHCRSDFYLAEEIMLEYRYKNELKKEQSDRLAAYQTALLELLSRKDQ